MCHSGIAGDFTMAAQERVEGGDGAQSLQATPGKNCGDGAGVEPDVRLHFVSVLDYYNS